MSESDITAFAESPWLLPILLLLIVGDAFVVVLPSETAVVALGSISVATGSPHVAALLGIAAVGAILGDSACYLIGRALGHDRWRWQREGRIAVQLARVRSTMLRRPATLIFTARYIPFARIAVNLSAGAATLAYRRFLPLSAAAGIGWALYNVAVGMFFGALFADQPIFAVVVSVVVAMGVGVAIDVVSRKVTKRRGDASERPEG
ncbi:MAG: DedA family protein [Microbacteriaceae bacterium]